MATYRLSAKLISRASGQSSTAAAAYRAAERIHDERTGEVFDYTRRSDVLDRAILAPEGAPAWTRELLWNAVEAAERRKDAQLAREVQVSLPHELSTDAHRALLHAFVREQFVDRGMLADVTIHAPHRGGDQRNTHAHIMLTTRELAGDGFGKKNRDWNDRTVLDEWRVQWERHLNRALERAQVADRVDHRSYAARGMDREAEPKQGPVATKMLREGRSSFAADDRRRVQERNAERERLRDDARRVAEDLREEERRHEAERQQHAESEQRRRRDAERLERERRETERPGIGAPDVPSWQRWREEVLSEAYAQKMAGSQLARFWHIERTRDGLAFENARGRFEDHGHLITARDGNDLEIRGMLDLAAVKGWTELQITGSEEFKRQGMAAALERGFTIDAKGLDAELLRDVERERDARLSERELEIAKHVGKPLERELVRLGMQYSGRVLGVIYSGDRGIVYLDTGRAVTRFELDRNMAQQTHRGDRVEIRRNHDLRVTVRALVREPERERERE